MYIGKVLLPFFVKCLILEYLKPFDVTKTLRNLDHPSVLFLFFVAVQNQRRKAQESKRRSRNRKVEVKRKYMNGGYVTEASRHQPANAPANTSICSRDEEHCSSKHRARAEHGQRICSHFAGNAATHMKRAWTQPLAVLPEATGWRESPCYTLGRRPRRSLLVSVGGPSPWQSLTLGRVLKVHVAAAAKPNVPSNDNTPHRYFGHGDLLVRNLPNVTLFLAVCIFSALTW